MKKGFFRFFVVSLILQLSMFAITKIAGAGNPGDKDDVEFSGLIEGLPASGLVGNWVVGGRTVHVSNSTRIKMEHGLVALNVFVEVKGSQQADGSVTATEIEVQSPQQAGHKIEFQGNIQTLPIGGLIGDWVVSGRTVHVSSDTRIKDKDEVVAAVGVFVEVKGALQPDGSVNATEIDLEAGPGVIREVKFSGFISALPASGLIGDWMVSGRAVHVTNDTRIKLEQGLVALNAFVEVEGVLRGDGSVDASEIEVKAAPGSSRQTDFKGFVKTLPPSGLIGNWVVEGRTVHVSSATHIKQEQGVVAVKAFVDVRGLLQSDGSVNATEIDVVATPGSTHQFQFEGFIDGLPAGGLIGDWVVSGHTVHVSSTTRVQQEHGVVALHAFVEVRGLLQLDGSINAIQIDVEASPVLGGKIKLQGFVDQLPLGGLIGNWVVSGRTVRVTVDTNIKAKKRILDVGSLVEVKGILLANGTLDANSIKLKF
ncbi:MAG: DUF5666 domain-containing protein [Blastocatellia bacterium]